MAADIKIHLGQNAAFEEALQRGVREVASRAKGFQGYKVNRGIESQERYVLQIFWDTLENHKVLPPRAAVCAVARDCGAVF